MAASYVSSGAVLSCSLGTATSLLEVSNYRRAKMYSENQATVEDCKGGSNIKPFQMCKRTLPNALVPCLYGGIITIEGNGDKV